MNLLAYNNIPVPSFMYGTAWKKEATRELVELAVTSGFTAIDTANQLIQWTAQWIKQGGEHIQLRG